LQRKIDGFKTENILRNATMAGEYRDLDTILFINPFYNKHTIGVLQCLNVEII
jgi:hypothetical protein